MFRCSSVATDEDLRIEMFVSAYVIVSSVPKRVHQYIANL